MVEMLNLSWTLDCLGTLLSLPFNICTSKNYLPSGQLTSVFLHQSLVCAYYHLVRNWWTQSSGS